MYSLGILGVYLFTGTTNPKTLAGTPGVSRETRDFIESILAPAEERRLFRRQTSFYDL